MEFEQALKIVRDGGMVRRPTWPKDIPGLTTATKDLYMDPNDIMSSDWIEIDNNPGENIKDVPNGTIVFTEKSRNGSEYLVVSVAYQYDKPKQLVHIKSGIIYDFSGMTWRKQ